MSRTLISSPRSLLASLVLMVGWIFLLQACGGGGGGGGAPPPAPVSNWTWVDGSTTVEQSGTYGTEDTAAAANVPGGRREAVRWVDSGGTLWLFGGIGFDSAGTFGYLNDLWKFNPSTGEWTWVDGSTTVEQSGTYGTEDTAAAANVPGGRRGAVSWIDSGGQLWLFGGDGRDSAGGNGYLNDLWKFNPATGEWTWVDGSTTVNQPGTYGTEDTAAAANVPGARLNAVSWVDSGGQLWLFGGYGFDSGSSVGRFNDLWKFNPATGEWTWVDGSTTVEQSGTYGTEDTAAAANVPGGRRGAVSWIDSGGQLWLFGGDGRDSTATFDYLNDLWKFNPATGEWTWVDGSTTVNQLGTYGTEDTAAAANVPGGRRYAVSWIDSGGQLWLFGGDGLDSTGGNGNLNDLWKFNPATGEWTWVDGSTTVNQLGTYGTEDTAAAANVPGARQYAVSWIDSGGQLWLFGGEGHGSTVGVGRLNDLWRYGL